MKNLLYLSLLLVCVFSCKKDYDKIDKEKLETYIQEKGIKNVQTLISGVKFSVEKEGTGSSASPADLVKIKYKGSLLDGTIFDKRDTAVWVALWRTIYGFQEGVSQFQKGGKGQIFIPSSLAYADTPPPSIPAYSPLVFDVEIEDIKNENQQIKDFIATKGWDAKSTFTGLYYVVDEPGTGSTYPAAGSTVTVKYKGYLLSGTVFDSSDMYTTALSNVIKGWQEGIPFFKKGGKGKIIMPSSLGYGSNGSGQIPPFAPLVFEIEVLNY
jgi:FKBP-type peptidyl-prolyl cis-trans isomerase FkpA